MDLFVVPTIGFKLLYGSVIVRIDRRDLVNATTNPTAEWRTPDHWGFSWGRSLYKDAPSFRPIQQTGIIRSHLIVGGLHHHYVRV